MMLKSEQEVLDKEYSNLIGRTIKSIRPLSKSELDDLYWSKSYGDLAFAIILDDGQVMIPAADPECNGPGFILTADLEVV